DKVSDERARRQMRGLIIFNMLAASDCRLVDGLYRSTHYPEKLAVQNLEQARDEGKGHYTAWFKGFEPLLQDTEFTGACVGSSSVVFQATEVAVDKALPGDVLNPWDDSTAAKQTGKDMEGRYGRVKFAVNQTFWMGADKSSPLLGMVMYPGGGRDLPDFWLGIRGSTFLPPGITGLRNQGSPIRDNTADRQDNIALLETEKDSSVIGRGLTYYGPYKSNESLYAWRVNTGNVPVVVRDPASLSDSMDGEAMLEKFLDSSVFVMCRGARGYVQSNAGEMNDGSEAAGDNPVKEDVVFPFIKLTRPGMEGESCVKETYGKTFVGVSAVPDLKRPLHSSGRIRCSLEQALERKKMGKIEMGEIDGKMVRKQLYCGFRKDVFDFSRLDHPDYRGEIDYYKTGFYADSSKGKDYEITEYYWKVGAGSSQGGESWATVYLNSGDNPVLVAGKGAGDGSYSRLVEVLRKSKGSPGYGTAEEAWNSIRSLDRWTRDQKLRAIEEVYSECPVADCPGSSLRVVAKSRDNVDRGTASPQERTGALLEDAGRGNGPGQH
ncbi:MAG: hypothetical protein ABEJ66_03770, partial [Candidatus Nanohaloarchaea archaeon]